MRNMVLMKLSILLLFSGTALYADQLVLVKGKGIDVCKEYGKNLKLFPIIATKYKRIINPDYKNFSKPKWLVWGPSESLPGRLDCDRLYPEDSHELFDKIDLFLWNRDSNPFMYLVDKDKKIGGVPRRTMKKRGKTTKCGVMRNWLLESQLVNLTLIMTESLKI